jgi:gliding motility-associatede transport system auxiliary component
MAGTKREIMRTLLSTTGLVITFLILILINVFVSYANIRWDATQDKIYSLSEGTKHILGNLKQPVEIQFYYNRSSSDVPDEIKLYATRVREFLSEYEHASGGRVKIVMYDPKPDSDEEEWAQKYGLQSVGTASGEKIYCGLVFLAADQVEKIEFLDPGREELLEYDITRIIQRLQSPKKKVIGVMSGLPVFGNPNAAGLGPQGGGGEWLFITELKKTYDVREIPLTSEKIDPSPDLLLVIHPKDISEKSQYAIDQYVLAGGKVILFVDPYCVSDQSRQAFMGPTSSSAEKLLKAWGISFDSSKVVADYDQTTAVRGRDNRVEQSPVMISARNDAFNSNNVVTAGLEQMLLPLAGGLKKAKESPYEFEPLIRSGKNAGLVDAFKAILGLDAIQQDFVRGKDRLSLAVQVSGKFKTAFPEGPPVDKKAKKDSAKTAPQNQLKEAADTRNVIVVADADLLADRFYVQRGQFLGTVISRVFNDNLNFLANGCETLTGSNDLIALRTRGRFERPFEVVQALQQRAQERWLSKEQELMKQAEETNRKLRELEGRKDASQKLLISPEQEKEVARFREQKTRINHELKEVRKNLRADIESLGNTLKAINIFLMPLFVAIAGLLFAFTRHRRMRRK